MKVPDFTISDSEIEKFFESFIPHCKNTGTNQVPSFGNEDSCLTSSQHLAARGLASPKDSVILAIDVGGTRTKACVKKTVSGKEQWLTVLDVDNNETRSEGPGPGLQRMTRALGARLMAACQQQSLALAFDAVAIVWSNKLQSFRLEKETLGVGARIFGCKSGQAYRKGEWWNSDLNDGDDISAAFLNGLEAAGIDSKVLIVGNDTVLTAQALPGGLGGVVASTGSNATIIPAKQTTLYNSECGGAISIPSSLLKLSDKNSILPVTGNSLKIEDVSAGKGLPLVFQLMLREAYDGGMQELESILICLDKQSLSASELGLLVSGKTEEALGTRKAGEIYLSASAAAQKIAAELITNAGKFCGILLLIAAWNQLESEPQIKIALDSSQARFVPGYRKALDDFLAGWNKKHQKQLSYELMQPQGQISVPLQGAARAVNEFLS